MRDEDLQTLEHFLVLSFAIKCCTMQQ